MFHEIRRNTLRSSQVVAGSGPDVTDVAQVTAVEQVP